MTDAAQRSSGVTNDRATAALRILRLEQERGFDNRAVVGGLDAFLSRWERDTQALPGIASGLAAQLRQKLNGYAELPAEERGKQVERAIALLARSASSPSASGSTPISANATAESRRIRSESPGGKPSRSTRDSTSTPLTTPTSPKGTSVSGSVPRFASAALHASVAVRRTAASAPARPKPALPPPNTPISQIPGIGPTRARLLARLGIQRVEDLLSHYPREHCDYPPARKARDLLFQRVASYVGALRELQVSPTSRGVKRFTATLHDETGSVTAVWFRGGYAAIKAKPGDLIAVSGPIATFGRHIQFENPDWEMATGEPVHTRGLVPIYPLTEGIGQYWLRGLIKQAVDAWADSLGDPLPAWIRQQHELPSLAEAIRHIHFPDTPERLELARRRLAFDELFGIQLLVLQRRLHWRAPGGVPLAARGSILASFEQALPFQLTAAQRRVLNEVLDDLAQSVPMTRLLQGEVGSGKTVVAAASLLAACACGSQGALMAPTELLAEQHYQTLSDLYGRAAAAIEPVLGHPVRVALLTGSTKGVERERILAGVVDGSIDVVVGTHALIQEGVEFTRLALVIIDEQHRFGVRQRVLLRRKGEHPHMLVMTATPIPRTLALTLYGDLDVSLIDQMPPGRQPVRTELLPPGERERAYECIREHVARGHQAFIICPIIEDSPTLEVRAATEEYKRLQATDLAGLRLRLLHGRMRSAEKESVMRAFHDRELDVLVSTAVVEVGVDVPNATVMLVEGAERFGLSQLHQFRGRVGRSSHAAVCLLHTDQVDADVRDRLKVLEESSNGLELADRDLQMRGPGEFFGVRQSGFPDPRMAGLTDVDLVAAARSAAARLLKDDPELAKPEHARLFERVERLLARGGDRD